MAPMSSAIPSILNPLTMICDVSRSASLRTTPLQPPQAPIPHEQLPATRSALVSGGRGGFRRPTPPRCGRGRPSRANVISDSHSRSWLTVDGNGAVVIVVRQIFLRERRAWRLHHRRIIRAVGTRHVSLRTGRGHSSYDRVMNFPSLLRLSGHRKFDSRCYGDGYDGGGDPVDGGAERRPPSGVRDVVGSVLPEVLEPVGDEADHESHADPVMATAASTTNALATAISTAMTSGRPSATPNPM